MQVAFLTLTHDLMQVTFLTLTHDSMQVALLTLTHDLMQVAFQTLTHNLMQVAFLTLTHNLIQDMPVWVVIKWIETTEDRQNLFHVVLLISLIEICDRLVLDIMIGNDIVAAEANGL